MASDSLNENHTKIIINVRDVNDLPPVFPQKNYNYTMDEEIAAPFRFLQVKLCALNIYSYFPDFVAIFFVVMTIGELQNGNELSTYVNELLDFSIWQTSRIQFKQRKVLSTNRITEM